jgi:trimeric autotransporter adhesin
MKQLIKLKTIALFLLPLVLTSFALLPSAQASIITDPDETFDNFNTAAGLEALLFADPRFARSNTAYGARALRQNTQGDSNVAIGGFALRNNFVGDMNIAVGNNALFHNLRGNNNTAVGQGALDANTDGDRNVAIGAQALGAHGVSDTVGVGYQALASNTTGMHNAALGFQVLRSNTTGGVNVGIGAGALGNNTTGSFNTATGGGALQDNIRGSTNTATGANALGSNTTGGANTATGNNALFNNTDGSMNTVVGDNAMFRNVHGSTNTAIGYRALQSNTTGGFNVALGDGAGSGVFTANDVICIGHSVAGVNVTGTCFIGNIRGVTTQNANAVPVLIDGAGQLGTASSSRRYKTEIKPMDKASESILALNPVSFRYKVHKDTTAQFGLIAEEVAEVNPDLVIYDSGGEPYTVRYDAVNAMLLNEFLKEHKTVQEQKATIAQLKQDFESKLAEQQKQIEALTAGLQKVSAQLEASKPTPQVVKNP